MPINNRWWQTGLPLVLFVVQFSSLYAGNPAYDSTTWIQPVLDNTEREQRELERLFAEESEPLLRRLAEVRQTLATPQAREAETGYALLWERIQLQDALYELQTDHELKKLKLRYRKGIEIVKMLYEKILAMDHHFSSLKAQQELLNISNPHFYPEFTETRNIIDERIKRKFGFVMPEVLQNNPYLSATFSLVGLVLNSPEDKEKKADPEKIACILDFTVRMHTDLNTVYYETGYLRDANLTLKHDCEQLFTECARQVGYTIPLESCRDGDDWERLYALLDNLVAKALGETSTPATTMPGMPPGMPGMPQQPQGDVQLQVKTETNLLFALERITQFITRYSDFVNQGNEYYKKFSKIVDTYEKDKACSDQLPDAFLQLEKDINQTLDKFNTAYRMPEVQGSKLKDMLYGVAEFN